MPMSDTILSAASREIGYREGKNKHNKFGEWFGMDGVAWCMEFVQWVYAQSGAPLPYKTASCGELLRWYRKNQPECVTETPVPGCIVIFDFPGTKYSTDHTGIFVRFDGRKITTIDGNTSNGNESNGGWVQQRTRSVLYAHPVYIVPRELSATDSAGGPPPLSGEASGDFDEKEDLEMKRYNTVDEIREELPWGVGTVQKLIDRKIILGNLDGLNLTEDMVRMLVYNDRAGLYGE